MSDIKDPQLYMKYIGVLTVMGELARSRGLSSDQRHSVDAAFADANKLLTTRRSGLRFQRSATGGYSPIDKEEPKS